jgi:hypothetical protein
MVVNNHEYYQTEGNSLEPGAQRPRGSRTRLGEPVSDDMSSRTGSVNFFKKIIFRLLKFFLRHPDCVRSTLGDYHRCPNTVRPRGREKLQRYGVRQPRGSRVATLWLSTTTSTIKLRATVSNRERSDHGGAGRDWESRSRTTCRLGRDPSTFLKKIIFRLLKFPNGIRPSTQYSRRLRTVLKHGTPKRARKVATLWWYTTKRSRVATLWWYTTKGV